MFDLFGHVICPIVCESDDVVVANAKIAKICNNKNAIRSLVDVISVCFSLFPLLSKKLFSFQFRATAAQQLPPITNGTQ